ncbi:MAG TPA: amino acid adenylation domain-containing protein, partial [Longimicrobium sp.]
GVLKAGGAYVPLDPSYPEDRLRHMLRDSGPVVVLAEGAPAWISGATGARVIDLARAEAWEEEPRSNPGRRGLQPENLAYVIYTSGSTGMPKGVMNSHAAVVNLLGAAMSLPAIGPGEGVLQRMSFSFDVSVREFFWPLAVGGRIIVGSGDSHRDPDLLVDTIRRQRVSMVHLVPSLLQVILEHPEVEHCSSLRLVVCGGEAITPALVSLFNQRLPQARLYQAYGPTETTVGVTARHCLPEAGQLRVPLGRPLANSRIYLLDAAGEVVPIGVVGEMYIGGAQVARGYLHQPALTAERFLPDPFSADPGARMYRTGDLGRWSEGGDIEFLGRNDAQVKVRGFRVELGEIEARLAEHPEVREAAVLARDEAAGGKQLVAYVVGDAPVEVLRAYLAERLPEHMVPAAFIRLDALPLSPNGKVDRKALPAPEGGAFSAREYEPPLGATETALAEIWAEVLGVERVGRWDDFFALGGHSLLAVRAVAHARRRLGARVTVADVFTYNTVESLAARLAGTTLDADPDRAIPLRSSGSEPPLFLVHEITGSVTYARQLLPYLDASIPVYALPAEPDDDRLLRTVEGMAARLARMIREVQPAGPYRVAGWSFGGTLAYEVATQLIGQNQEVDFLGMIDTHFATRSGEAREEYGLLLRILRMEEGGGAPSGAALRALESAAATMDLDDLVTLCHESGLLPAHVTHARVRMMSEGLRANARALRDYVAQPIPHAVHLFPASESAVANPSLGWDALLPAASLHVTTVPGNHLSMMAAPNAATLGHALSRAIAHAPTREAARSDSSPLVTLRYGGRGIAPLFCITGAGAGVTSFSELAGSVDAPWPVYGFQPRGLDPDTVPHATVEAAAEWYLAELDRVHPVGPVHLLGHSFGGWVAFEMARRLVGAGREVGSLTLLDSEPPDVTGSLVREYDGGEAFLKLVRAFEQAAERSLGISPADITELDAASRLALLHDRVAGAGLLPRRSNPSILRGPLRAFSAALRANYTPGGAYAGPLRLVLVCDPTLDTAANHAEFARMENAWRSWAPDVRASLGAGNHMTALKPPHVHTLAAWLAEDRMRGE